MIQFGENETSEYAKEYLIIQLTGWICAEQEGPLYHLVEGDTLIAMT